MTTKDKIAAEALSQFNQKGLHQVGVREIARRLQMSPGNMSYHFPKKEDLLLYILKSYGQENEKLRTKYMSEEPSIDGFISMFRYLFENQYEHRGIFAELVEVNRVLEAQTDFNYQEGQNARIEELNEMVTQLQQAGILKNGDNVRSHLVSFLTLFGRFWIAEAFLSDKINDKKNIIDHYIEVLRGQLKLYLA